MNRARQWLANSDAVWKEADKRFTFPSGATITFGYLDSEDDVYQYDSSEFQYIGFDELTSFTEAAVHLSVLALAHDQGQPAAAADALGVESRKPRP